MTLKELLDKVSELCNEETKDLKVAYLHEIGWMPVDEIWHYRLKNDYIVIDEIRIS